MMILSLWMLLQKENEKSEMLLTYKDVMAYY